MLEDFSQFHYGYARPSANKSRLPRFDKAFANDDDKCEVKGFLYAFNAWTRRMGAPTEYAFEISWPPVAAPPGLAAQQATAAGRWAEILTVVALSSAEDG